MKLKLKALAAALTSAFLSTPVLAESCADTTFTLLNWTQCAGSLPGNIIGSQSEIDYLAATWGTTFSYLGKSDDADNGPFANNPQTAVNGTLTFDSALTGSFVLGLKASDQYSYYLFNALSPVSSLTFSSTSGVALNDRGIPQGLSHATLYVGAVPEPETYALFLAGLGAIGFMAKRRRKTA